MVIRYKPVERLVWSEEDDGWVSIGVLKHALGGFVTYDDYHTLEKAATRLLDALKASQKAIKELRGQGAPVRSWADICEENAEAIEVYGELLK